jgi:DnaJ domain
MIPINQRSARDDLDLVTSRRNDDEGLYRLLDVPPGASRAEISRAYRRLAQASHPDTHPDDADAPRRFLAITEAYEILSDPQRRARYDRDQPRLFNSQPGPAASPIPPRPAGPVPTVVFGEPGALVGPTVIGARSTGPSGSTPLIVGPLQWRPDPDASRRPAPTADMQALFRALQRLGWW